MKRNFEKDIIADIRAKVAPVKLSRSADFSSILLDYLTLMRKLIPAEARVALLSSVLKNKYKEYKKRKELSQIIYDTINGKDLNPYQTDTLTQVKFHDRLLYNWNIHHLHVSAKKIDGAYFRKRTNDLVFVRFDDGVAYFLDVGKHGPGNFANEYLLKILKDNWPDQLEAFRGDVLFQKPQSLTPVDRQKIWDRGFTIGMTTIDGKVYVDEGVGTTMSGHSIRDVMAVNNICRWFYELEKWFDIKESSVSSEISMNNNISIDKLKFRARISNNTIVIYEVCTSSVVVEYPNLPAF